jgi:hypothetical protein
METGTFPLSSTVTLEHVIISVNLVPASYPVSGRDSEYELPPVPRFERTVIVCEPASPFRMASVLLS